MGAFQSCDLIGLTEEDQSMCHLESESALKLQSFQDFLDGTQFKVVLNKGDDAFRKVGIDIAPVDDVGVLVHSVEDSDNLVQAWNQANPDREIRRGDMILEVNGVRENRPKIIHLLQCESNLVMTVRRTKMFCAHINKTESDQLGFDVILVSGCRSLLVCEVSEGLIMEWNRTHQGVEVRTGDFVIEVNDCRYDGDSMLDALRTQNPLDIVFYRKD